MHKSEIAAVFFRRGLLLALLTLALAVPEWVGAQTSIRRIVVFGMSLSDPGNAYAIFGGTNTPPNYQLDDLLIPPHEAPYARGGHHFSNGATWVEQLARAMRLAPSAGPAWRSASAGASNYAVGGARAWEDGINVNLSQQLQKFLQDQRGEAPSDALYVVAMGGNDIRDALEAYMTAGEAGAGQVIGQALAAIGGSIFELYRAGARKFLVWNVPDLAVTPAIQTLDRVHPGAAFLAHALSVKFNYALENDVLAGLERLPEIQLIRFDAYATLQDIVANRARFGLSNVSAACIMPNVPPFECKNPDEYFFWDGIHPTAVGHAIISQEAARLLSH